MARLSGPQGQISDTASWGADRVSGLAPESPAQLTEAIRDVLDNTGEAEKAGRKAREKCIDLYSRDAIEKELAGICQRF